MREGVDLLFSPFAGRRWPTGRMRAARTSDVGYGARRGSIVGAMTKALTLALSPQAGRGDAHAHERHPARGDRGAAGGGRLCRRPRPRDRAVDDGRAQAPAADRGRGGRRQDRSRQGARRRARRGAHPHAVLRGARRQFGALRVELPAPAARDQGARGNGRERGRDRGAHLLGGLSARAPAARGHPARGRRRCC